MKKTRTLTVSDLLATLPKSARVLGFKNLSNSFLVYFKYVSHICIAFHLIQARRLAIFAAGIFYAYGFRYEFRPPCGALMRPLPVSGGMQRESGTLFVPFPSCNQFIVSFKSIPK